MTKSSVIEGLAAYKARKDAEEARREAASKPKLNRFNLVKDGDSAVVRFGQEIDREAANFNEARGIGFVNIEHNHPDPNVGWRNRANCSIESQGACLPCEKVQDYSVEWDQRKGWKQKEKFYINIIAGEAVEVDNPNPTAKNKKVWLTTDIDKATGDGVVYLLEQGTFNGIYDALANYFLETDISNETITDKFFKITRKGSKFNDTSYNVVALKEIPADAKSLDEFELINVKEDVLQEIPYAQQDAFYHQGVAGVSAPAPQVQNTREAVTGATTGTDQSW